MSALVRNSILVVLLASAVIAVTFFYSFNRKLEPAPEPAAPQIVDPVTLHAAMREGLQAVRENRPEDARSAFERVPETDPSRPLALRELAGLLTRSGEFDEAAHVVERFLLLQPDDAMMLLELGWLRYNAGRYADAEVAALQSLEADPQAAGARYAIGLFRLADGRLAEAIPVYTRAMETDGSRTTVTVALQRLFELQARRPELSSVHYALAFFANAMGNTEVEIEELEQFLASDPAGAAGNTAQARLAEARAALAAPPAP